jgi:hypothetical protein
MQRLMSAIQIEKIVTDEAEAEQEDVKNPPKV